MARLYLLGCAILITCGLGANGAATKKLSCQPGESRDFVYESDTNLWGPIQQRIKLAADIELRCLGSVRGYNTTAHKYLVQIKRVQPRIVRDIDPDILPPKPEEIRQLRKSGVGEWFVGAWESIKNWFMKIFSRARSSGSAEGFLVDLIGSRCRNKNKHPTMEDFDRDAVVTARMERQKRSDRRFVYDRVFSVPFEFIQSEQGRIVEVLFSPKDTEQSVKNFKKHIADSFATNTDPVETEKVPELSPMGEHLTTYSVEPNLPQAMASSSGPVKLADSGLIKLVNSVFGSEPGGPTRSPDDHPITVVRNIWDEDVVKLGSGGSAESQDDVSVYAKHVQQISAGQVIGAVGRLSVKLISDIPQFGNGRQRRDSGSAQPVGDYFKIETHYTMKVAPNRPRRSASLVDMEQLKKEESELRLVSEPIGAKTDPKESAHDRLVLLRVQIAEKLQKRNVIKVLLEGNLNGENAEILSALNELLDLESRLGADRSDDSFALTLASALSLDKVESVCGARERLDIRKCRELLLAGVKSGSDRIIGFLMDSLDFGSDRSGKELTLKIISQANRPNEESAKRLIRKFRAETDPDLRGHLVMAATSLAGDRSMSQPLVGYVIGILIGEMDRLRCEDNLLIDILESAGNLNDTLPLERIAARARTCPGDGIKVAAIHSTRKIIRSKPAIDLYLELFRSADISCVVKREILEVIDSAETNWNQWPRNGFNRLDEYLLTNQDKLHCLSEQLIKYWSIKSDPRAREALTRLNDARTASLLRSRRAVESGPFWDDSQCKVWDKTMDAENAAELIVVSDRSSKRNSKHLEREELDSTASYLKRRKCTAHKNFGPDQAQCTVRADIVNDLIGSEQKPEYKLLAQFAVGSKFLGKDIDIGRMYLYNRKDKGRAYVNMFGRTLLDVARNNCDSNPGQPYRYSTYVPLYDFDVWAVQVSMGLRMSGEMALNPIGSCEYQGRSSTPSPIILRPDANVRASGAAVAKMVVVRGGVDVGGDFNVHSDLEFTPSPDLCLTATAGHRPMNVSVQSWYSFYDAPCSEWMDKNIWRPEQLNWVINSRFRRPWLNNECLRAARHDYAVDP